MLARGGAVLRDVERAPAWNRRCHAWYTGLGQRLLIAYCCLTDPAVPQQGPSDASPDEGVVEDLPLIDEKAMEQLTEGLISHYLPDLQRSKSALQELTQNQVVLLETLEQEISKFKECNSILDINALFSEAKHYHNKLVNIRNEMMMLHEKTSKLKKRALKLQQKRQKEELEREQQREKELEREKQLTAKLARRT
nr:PREDICTED: biogenesis of lysosome-related organelles complex 1 subunit 6 [Opisthocomus hoazin]